jgi:uncharacterized repeat protein (TIGR03803 family)
MKMKQWSDVRVGAVVRRGMLTAGISLLCFQAASPALGVTFSTPGQFYGTNGAQPTASLTLGTNGDFYGVASAGGLSGNGVVFQATLSGSLTALASLNGTNSGSHPMGALVQGADGNFYGTASAGGEYGNGTVFVVSPTGALMNLAAFAGTNGAQPRAGLFAATNGVFYGTTYSGGTHGLGTVFMLGPDGVLTTLVSFNGSNGSYPVAGLALGTDGNLYGVTSAGGTYNAGSIFSISSFSTTTIITNGPGNPTNRASASAISISTATAYVFTNLYFFTGAADGAGPQGTLVVGSDGSFYGTTSGGGTNNTPTGGNGTVFNFSPGGGFSSLFSFARTNGANPSAALAQANDGSFYGTARSGGAFRSGTVFNLATNGTLTLLHSFTAGADGADPYYAGLVEGMDGNLYGLTSARGRNGSGTFYRIAGFMPFIVTSPANQTVPGGTNITSLASLTVPVGTNITLTVSAGGSQPLKYQWQLNAHNLTDNSRISGSTNASLTISNTITADSGTYSVIVRNTSGSITNTNAVLTVIGPYGTNVPVVHITSPAQGAVLQKAVITVAGTSSSSVPVTQVFYQLNGSGWQLASPRGNWASWTAKVLLQPGQNVLQAYAVNNVGTPSEIVTVSFVCGVTSASVMVQISGSGTVSPNYNGQWLEVGRTYKMTARPGNGYVFSNWVETVTSNSPVLVGTPGLSFTVQSNLVLQANFVPNPFLPLSGSYNGLFYVTNGVTPDSAGSFAATVTRKGAFTGKVQLGAGRYAIRGQFDANGDAQASFPGPNTAALYAVLHLDLSMGTERITGIISNATWTATLAADRAVFDGRTSIAPQAGRYTLVLPGDYLSASQPGGDSYGTITLTAAGRIILAGALADGTKLTQSVPVSKDGLWPLCIPLYHGQGLLLGWLSFSNAPAAGVGGVVTWLKPQLPQSSFYPNRFVVQTNVLGSLYQAPADPSANPLGLANAELLLNGGNLAASITNQLTLGPGNQITVVSGPGVKLTFTRATGLFHGTATDPNAPKPVSFNGVVLQTQATGRGFFLGPSLSGQVFLGP